MIKGVKLRRLYEQHMNATGGRGAPSYAKEIRKLLGISETVDRYGVRRIDHKARAVHPSEFSLQETAMALLGMDWQDQILGGGLSHVANMRAQLQEADGAVVMPSTFSAISAFTDTVAGLLEAMVMEALDSPAYIADQVTRTVPTRVNGGKIIGILNDGKGSEAPIPIDEPLPMVGLKGSYVEVPDNEKYGHGIQLHELDFIYDRTDKVQSSAEAAAESTLRRKEIRVADKFLGVINDYTRDGTACNTYKTTAAASPNDFINSDVSDLALVNYTDLDEAVQVLEQNTDPGTGFEITLVKENWRALVMPQRSQNARSILHATEVRNTTNTAYQTLTPASAVTPQFGLVEASRIWYNRLVLAAASGGAGLSAANAVERWHLFNPAKFMLYRSLIPYRFRPATISSEEMRRGISYVAFVDEHGVPVVAEPRYSGRFGIA